MAKKPATNPAIDDIPPAMDYAQHEATYRGFLTLSKWIIAGLAVLMVALYFFIEGNNPVLGTLLLLVIPVGGVAAAVMGTRR